MQTLDGSIAHSPRARAHRPALTIVATLLALAVALGASSLAALGLLALAPLSSLLRQPDGLPSVRRRLLGVAPVVLVVGLAHLLTTPCAAGSSHAAPWSVMLGCVPVALRIVTAALWMSWLTSVLSARELDSGMLRLGAPVAFVGLFGLTRRFAAQLQGTMAAAWAAAALRGGFNSSRALCATVGPVAGVVVVRSLDRGERVSSAMALRGCQPTTEAPSS